MKTKLESPFSIGDIVKYKHEIKESKNQQRMVEVFFEVIEINIQQCHTTVQVWLTVRPIRYEKVFKLQYEFNEAEEKEWDKSGKIAIKHLGLHPHYEGYVKMRSDEVVDANSEFKNIAKKIK